MENLNHRIAMSKKDALLSAPIKYYLQKDELHTDEAGMEKLLEKLKGRQKPYELDMDNVKGKVESKSVDGFNCYTFYRDADNNDKHIIAFCGGAFCQEASKYHVRFFDTLAKKSGIKITMVAYPKVPTYQAHLTYSISEKVYRKILEKTDHEKIVLMGDSSGASIALTLPEYFKRKELPKPGAVIAYSPACAVKKHSSKVEEYQKRDPFLIFESVRIPVRLWRESAGDIICDPMEVDVSSLPETIMFTGSEDLLLPDMEDFVEKVGKEGGKISFYIFEGMFHDYHLQYMTTAAEKTMKETCAFLNAV